MTDVPTPRMGILDEMTLPEVEAFDPEIVIIPLGSTEPHGPHLPYCTDALRAKTSGEDGTVLANERGVRALCYPMQPIGMNVNFGWPFALGFKVSTYMAMLMDLCEQIEAWGVRRILLLNAHGGNTSVIDAFLRDWAYRGLAGRPGAEDHAFVCCVSGGSPKARELITYPSNHAGEGETLSMMAMRPELVRMDKLEKFPFGKPALELFDTPLLHWVRPWHLHVPRAAGGETRTVTKENAEKLNQVIGEWFADVICELCSIPWSNHYPYE
jgi:creatinine amidohydrolase